MCYTQQPPFDGDLTRSREGRKPSKALIAFKATKHALRFCHAPGTEIECPFSEHRFSFALGLKLPESEAYPYWWLPLALVHCERSMHPLQSSPIHKRAFQSGEAFAECSSPRFPGMKPTSRRTDERSRVSIVRPGFCHESLGMLVLLLLVKGVVLDVDLPSPRSSKILVVLPSLP